MKKHLFAYLLLILCLLTCAREKPYVKILKPPPSKIVALPETEKGKPQEYYVVNGKRYYPLPDSQGFVQFGKASWYGKKFHGRPTASGEIFDMYQKSAAHKTLAMGTYVEVTNLTNRKRTILRINDRGPFIKERIIDLSYTAAKEIDLIGPGVIDVKIVALGMEVGKLESERGFKPLVKLKDPKKGNFSVQVGAFKDKKNASKIADRLKVIFSYVTIKRHVDENRRTLYRVHVSKSKTLTQAGTVEKRLEDMGFTEAFIVRI